MPSSEALQLEELRKQIKLLNSQLSDAQRRAEQKAQRVDALESALRREKAAKERERAEKVKAQERVKELEKTLVLAKACGPQIWDVTARCLDMLFGPDALADIPQADKDRLEQVIVSHRAEFENLPQFHRIMRFFFKGSESVRGRCAKKARKGEPPVGKINDPLGNTVPPIARDIESRNRALVKTFSANGMAATQQAQEHPENQTVRACADIASVSMPACCEQQAQASRGRQKVQGLQPLQDIPETVRNQCPHCHSRDDIITGVSQVRPIRRLAELFGKLVEFGTVFEEYSFCRKCGKAFVSLPEDDVPCTPQNTLSQGFVISFAVFNAAGVPLNKLVTHMVGAFAQMGGVTLGRSVHEWALSYGDPLLECLLAHLAGSPVVHMDETPLTVLQSRGQGVCKSTDKPRQQDYRVCQFLGWI